MSYISNNNLLLDSRFKAHLQNLSIPEQQIDSYITENLSKDIEIVAYINSEDDIVYPHTPALYPEKMNKVMADKLRAYLKEKEYRIYCIRLLNGFKNKIKLHDAICLQSDDNNIEKNWEKVTTITINKEHKFELTFGWRTSYQDIGNFRWVQEAKYVLTTEDGKFKTKDERVYAININKREAIEIGAQELISIKTKQPEWLCYSTKEAAEKALVDKTPVSVEQQWKLKFNEEAIRKYAKSEWKLWQYY